VTKKAQQSEEQTKKSTLQRVPFRLEQEFVDRVKALCQFSSDEGTPIRQQDMMGALIKDALQRIEERAKKSGKNPAELLQALVQKHHPTKPAKRPSTTKRRGARR